MAKNRKILNNYRFFVFDILKVHIYMNKWLFYFINRNFDLKCEGVSPKLPETIVYRYLRCLNLNKFYSV